VTARPESAVVVDFDKQCTDMTDHPDIPGHMICCWLAAGHKGMHWDDVDSLWWGVVVNVVTEASK
jgi:hypothetical protein